MNWTKLSHEQIKERVFESLKKNMNYADEIVLGVPASYLDSQVFSQDNTILKDAPFLIEFDTNNIQNATPKTMIFGFPLFVDSCKHLSSESEEPSVISRSLTRSPDRASGC